VARLPAYFHQKFLREYITSPNTFNVQNTMNLISDLNTIDIYQNTRMCSFEITNMYANTPLNSVVNIIRDTLTKEYPQTVIREIDTITKIIMEQNYFQHKNHFYKQKEGLAMGAPSSSILSEIYLQFLEHNEILKILSDHKIASYSRYVDDILLLCNHTNTNIEQVSNAFNSIHSNIQFTTEKDNSNKINFIDITVHRLHSKLEYNIYRKPTSTSIIIHNNLVIPWNKKQRLLTLFLIV
jgi:hypothetical protein